MSGEARKGAEALFEALGKLGQGLVDAVVDAATEVAEELEDFVHPEPDEKRLAFDYDFVAPLAMLHGIPKRHLPSPEWLLEVGKVAVLIHANQQGSKRVGTVPCKHISAVLGKRAAHGEKLSVESELKRQIGRLHGRDQHERWFRDLVQSIRIRPDHDARVPDLKEYEAQFHRVPLPMSAKHLDEDAWFANLRLAGPNPTSLVRVESALPPKFPLSEGQFQAVLPGDSLSTTIAAGRAYLLDFAGLQPVIDGTYPARQKFGYEPIALFVVADSGDLVPVAIQGGQDPAAHDLVFPSDGAAWKIARTMVQVADANFHELVAHLGRTHLLIEPFPIVTDRCLDEDHPLRVLLEPHFEGTLFINWAAGDFLVAPKNVVDELLSGTIDADRTLSVKISGSRGFNDSFLPTWLAAQGLDDTERLPHFPFRDDGLRVWKAIHDWVTEYVGIHWLDDAAVQGDTQLQAWALELASFDGGRVAGFGDGAHGAITTRDYLIEALTMVIFTGSAMHAAVNFPQRSVMSFTPGMPLAGYRPAPAPGEALTEHDWQEFLPGLDQSLIQLNVLTLLGGVYYTRLGYYPPDQFRDARVIAAADRFKKALAVVEIEIEMANKQGLRERYPYRHLLPSAIPQSINI